VLEQKVVTDSYQQLMAQAIVDDRPLPAITDSLDSGTGTGSGTVSLFPISYTGSHTGTHTFQLTPAGITSQFLARHRFSTSPVLHATQKWTDQKWTDQKWTEKCSIRAG
jgi:hypothetical protein